MNGRGSRPPAKHDQPREMEDFVLVTISHTPGSRELRGVGGAKALGSRLLQGGSSGPGLVEGCAVGRGQAEERMQHYRPWEGSFAQEAINGPAI